MNTHNFIRLILYFSLSITILSCSLEEVVYQDTAIKVSFANQTQTMTQEMASISIPVKLDPKAIANGFITIELTGNAAYDTDFTTVPAAVNNKLNISILTNTQETSFVVNRLYHLATEKTINFKLINPTTGFSLGNRINSELKLNAQPTNLNKINFDASTGTISEGSLEGMVIGLNTSTAVSNGSHTKVKLTIPEGITYGTHFYTIPAAVSNEIPLEFNQNTQNTSFKVIPINDNLVVGDYSLIFEIIEANGGLLIGNNNVFTASILENDYASGTINSIAELKAKFNDHQGNWYLSQEYLIEGVITSNGNTLDNKSVYIQDATGGILIRFNTANIFNLGDKLRLNLVNGTGTFFNGQKCIDQVSLHGFAKYAENVVVDAETITIAQLYSGNYEGKKVKIENVHFVNADGTLKFLGNRTIKHEDATAIVTTYAGAAFSDFVVPQGTKSVTGIVGDFGHLMPQKYTHDITY